ncbi:MAG: protein translocase subunit SecD [Alphaproteobacteria bacterium]|nr:protein translocase subunit SecD [Alphaproteobacteria bacterium]
MIHIARWRIWTIIAVVSTAVVIALPNVIPSRILQNWSNALPVRTLSLGLDLQGGSHLLFQLDADTILKERFSTLGDTVRSELSRQNIEITDFASEGNVMRLRLVDATQAEATRRALRQVDEQMLVTESGGLVTATQTLPMQQAIRDQAMRQSIEIIRRRIDETGTREPSIEQQGGDRILVQLPGVRDPDHIKQMIGTTARLTFRMVDTTATAEDIQNDRAPAGSDLLIYDDGRVKNAAEKQPVAKVAVRKRIMVSGDKLVDAQPGFGQDGQPIINFRFDALGARAFGDATTENVGKPFAIVLDNKVLSAPIIREPIPGGRGQISGNFTTQSASDLAILLRAGALPAPLQVIEERSVGPGLGADSIRSGMLACALGFISVAVLMLVIYGKFGVMANLALIVNLVLIVAAMTLLQATLTLPGIAGIVLTMGIAVDSNVLIFERIREEENLGRGVIGALDLGFKRALAAIVDSNVTTLVATLFLYVFGSGPIRGFAITLTIGILASMFTAVTFTHFLMVMWFRIKRPKRLLA